MKKYSFLLFLMIVCGNHLFAQLNLSADGNVGVTIDPITPLSALSVGCVGAANTKVYITGNDIGLNVLSAAGTTSPNWTYGIIGTSNLFSNQHIGVLGQSFSTTALNSKRAFGVFGLAGNSSSGYNYGVFGTTYGSQNGAGIVGTTGNNRDVNVPGVYAGYFVGNVAVTGTVNGIVLGNSDIRYKKNIVQLSSKKRTLDDLLLLNPIEYNLEQMYDDSKTDSAKVKLGRYDEKSQMFQKKHFGLIAQDLQKLYPDLVYEDVNGYLSVNYIGIIPLLIESIKDLKTEVETLSAASTKTPAKVKVNPSSDLALTDNEPAALFQNNPNPFSQSTQIKYYLPSTVHNANLCIYDLQGKQLKQITISERGAGSQIISASEFVPGIYLYGLLVDGNEVDVKRMILTK